MRKAKTYTVVFIPNKLDRDCVVRQVLPSLGIYSYYVTQVSEEKLRDMFSEEDPLYVPPAEDTPIPVVSTPAQFEKPSPLGCVIMLMIAALGATAWFLTHRPH